MWSKMLLSSINILFFLTIVNSDNKIIFSNASTPIRKNPNNETGTTSTTVQPLQPQPSITINDTVQKETLKLGLLNATLNIEKSLDYLNTQNLRANDNIIISPLSIIGAMSLILLAARGESKIELAKLFGFSEKQLIDSTEQNMQNYKALGNLLNSLDRNSDNNLSVQLNVAKTIFVQNGYNITTYYKSAIKDYLNTELTPVDFKLNGQQAQQIINKWVDNQTNGNIKDIMEEIPLPETKTIIASAVYFSGEWEYPFFINFTRIRPFYLESSTDGKRTHKQNTRDTVDKIYIPMMVGSSEVFYHKNDELEFKAIGLPYKGNQSTAYFVLPNNNVSLRSIITRMNKNTLRNITKNAILSEFIYLVPKMVLESFTNLKPVLKNLGINKIFNPLTANLSNMATEPQSYIDDILHKVNIVFNEVGTVASAATIVTITRSTQPAFNVNKPFIFFIHNEPSDTILFWGTVHKPTPYTTTPPYTAPPYTTPLYTVPPYTVPLYTTPLNTKHVVFK